MHTLMHTGKNQIKKKESSPVPVTCSNRENMRKINHFDVDFGFVVHSVYVLCTVFLFALASWVLESFIYEKNGAARCFNVVRASPTSLDIIRASTTQSMYTFVTVGTAKDISCAHI